jgi:RimJ/RimL family protein N-acetyltransferase
VHPVRLSGQKIVLREFTLDDTDGALAVVGDERVTTWLSFDRRGREQTAAMIAGAIQRSGEEPRNEYYLAVVRSDAVIGFARLGLSGVQAAKLGYAIAADHQGHGYATDAVRTLVTFGFGSLKLHRITAAIGPDNLASIAVINRLGFVIEGRLRDHVFTNGAWRDSVLYSLLAREFVASSE